MKTRNMHRPATVSAKVATKEIEDAGLELVKIRLIDASGKRVASADAVGRTDLQWEATVKVAEFPFSKDGDDEPKDDAPESDGSDDGDSDDDDSDDPLGLDVDEPKDDGPDEDDSESKVLSLVTEIARHLGIPIPGEEDPLAPEGEGEGNIDIPDVDMPPVDAAPPAKDKPLPLPVDKKAPGAGGGVFSHVVVANSDAIKGRRSFVAVVSNANVLNDGEIVNEARIAFPGYRVAARIDRKTLVDSNEARVPMVADAKAN